LFISRRCKIVGKHFCLCIRKTVVTLALYILQVTLFCVFSLTVHLSITLTNDQLVAQIFNTFITILYTCMFRAISCSSSGGQIVLIQHLISSLSVNDSPVHRCAPDGHLLTVTIPDAVLIQFYLLRMGKILLETCTFKGL
jgi:hypothetical protein